MEAYSHFAVAMSQMSHRSLNDGNLDVHKNVQSCGTRGSGVSALPKVDMGGKYFSNAKMHQNIHVCENVLCVSRSNNCLPLVSYLPE